ncbi:TetR/AcrR family transcriptional regulator [Streptomyces sp. ODS28]|uniref:TetR/AcrR family transcriptional regulator n=1 Tax=Streptomyces sp. ODS28 TaxID=3136688 RepID=UPI0031E7C10A
MREQQIIDVAVRVFSERGYHAASVDEIAELAGISKPMVYLYLDSKEGLFLACVRREAGRLGAAFREAALRADGEAPAASPELRLRAGLVAFFAFVAEHREAWVVLHRQAARVSEAANEELGAVRGAVLEQVAGLVRDSVPRQLGEEQTDFVAHALVGAADQLTDWMDRHPGETPERVTSRLMNMVWVGMRDALRGDRWAPPARGC